MIQRCLLKVMVFYPIILFAVISTPKQAWSQALKGSLQPPGDLDVLVLDPQLQPVKGAKIGFSACFGDLSYKSPSWTYLPDPATQERFPREVQTDKRGIATFKGGKGIASNFRISLVARHEDRRLSGIVNLPRTGNDEVRITLSPECRVSGKLECPELTENGIELERNSLNVSFEGRLCVEYYSRSPVFEIFLPPGEYTLEASGGDGGTLIAKRSLLIPEGVAEMKLNPIQLSLKGSRNLVGRPAPDLVNVMAWKGDGPKSLQDLKGNVVLLDFWGYWCHSCVAKIPRLIELDNRYRDRGLRILGLHIDSGRKITSLSDYDKYVGTLDRVLKGKEIAYPVALIAEKPTPFRGNSAKNATCKIAAEYGVNSYPTMILIDRAGNVAGEFRDTPEGLVKLEALLRDSFSNDP